MFPKISTELKCGGRGRKDHSDKNKEKKERKEKTKKKERNQLKATIMQFYENERIIYVSTGGVKNKAALKGQCIALEK